MDCHVISGDHVITGYQICNFSHFIVSSVILSKLLREFVFVSVMVKYICQEASIKADNEARVVFRKSIFGDVSSNTWFYTSSDMPVWFITTSSLVTVAKT